MKQRKSKALDNLLLFVAGAYPYVCFLVFMLLASGRLSTDGGMLALAYINGFAMCVALLAFRHDFVSVREAIAEVFASYPRMKRALYATACDAWTDLDEDEVPVKAEAGVPHLREVV